jgi:acyl-CoA synthetase (AMP-forming)/AMP-acid ligase II
MTRISLSLHPGYEAPAIDANQRRAAERSVCTCRNGPPMTALASDDRRYDNLGYFSWAAAKRRPDAVAIIDLSRDTPVEVTYREFDERLDRVAALMRRLGIGPGDRLAMAVGNRFEFLEIMYGAMRAGVVPVPLNTRLGADALDYIIRDAGCVAAVVEPAVNTAIVGVIQRIGMRARLAFDPVPPGWLDYERELQATPPSFEPPELSPEHPSFQPYTSGSTGRPKGVVLTHAGQMWWIRAAQRYWPLAETDRALTAVPLYHKNAMAGAIKTFLHAGASSVILPSFEPRRFLQTLAKHRITHSGGVPAVFTLLLQHRDLIAKLDFSALKGLKIGSAPTPRELQEAVEDAFGVPVGESYGLTEGGPVMIGPPVDGRPTPKGSCGVAWPEGEVELVGPDGKEAESYGELWVKNPGVTPGYHNLPEVNRERLVDGWLKTGDLFSRDENGFFFFKGRTDDMFNSGGENIYPIEVEGLLLTNPDIADVSVVPYPHAIKGEVPVALAVKRAGSKITEKEVRDFALAKGPAYAHPRRVLFVDALPLSGVAKTDRTAVKKLAHDMLGDVVLGKEAAE